MFSMVLFVLACVAFHVGYSVPISDVHINHGSHVNRMALNVRGKDYIKGTELQKINGVKFLVAVNDTWGSCITTVRTPMLKPNVPANESQRIVVGNCDSGPLTYGISPGKGGNVTIDLTFYSSVIEDASPPTCSIPFSGGFLTPTTLAHRDGSLPSVLPGCSTMDSREGYHMTYYWFYIYDIFLG